MDILPCLPPHSPLLLAGAMSPLRVCNGRVFDTDKSKTLPVCACRRRVLAAETSQDSARLGVALRSLVGFGGWLQFLEPPASQPGV